MEFLRYLRICYNKSMNSKTPRFSILDFPEQLRSYIKGANLSDSSSHSSATVLYIDSGYYLKIDQKGRLAQETKIASWFETEGLGTPVITYLSANKDFLLTKEAIGSNALAFLNQPERLCQTLAQALNKLHSLKPQSFPSENHLKRYKEKALKTIRRGLFITRLFCLNFTFTVVKKLTN